MTRYVTPNCCSLVKRTEAIRLEYKNLFQMDNFFDNANYLKYKPVWTTFGPDLQLSSQPSLEVKFCPFCGQKLPAIQQRSIKGLRVCKITDGGYYCDTCGDRLSSCSCLPIAFNWEPIPCQTSN